LTHRIGPSTPAGRRVATGAAALLLALTMSACGGSDDPGAGTPAATGSQQTGSGTAATTGGEQQAESITVTEADFEINLDEDSFPAGAYEIEVVNEGDSTHNVVVERDGESIGQSDAVDPGQSTTFTVTLEPGEYVLFCSIANHRAMGMETTIEVT
jgi:plastocyanin